MREVRKVTLLLQDLAAELGLGHLAIEMRWNDAIEGTALGIQFIRKSSRKRRTRVRTYNRSSSSVGMKLNDLARKTSIWTT